MRTHIYLGLVALLTSGSVFAYDTETHAFITSEAIKRSALEDPTRSPALMTRLGFDRLDATHPFGLFWLFTPTNYLNAPLSAIGPEYYDNLASNTPNSTYARAPQNYEQQQMVALRQLLRVPVNTVNLDTESPVAPIRNWIVRGAIREDDLTASNYGPEDQVPDPDPRGPFQRSYNHFYDPINDVKLHYTIGGTDVDCFFFPSSGNFCYTSLDWAMGTLNTLSSTPTEDTNRHNHFTWWDARNNYFWALTQQGGAGDGATVAIQREAASENRMRRWATAFRSLGDVLHLLEDGAQPQHTRNDPHTPYLALDTAAQQAYEPYINARVLRTTSLTAEGNGEDFIRSFFGGTAAISAPNFDISSLESYPVPQFKRPQDFFTTRSANPNTTDRRGLVDYSNRGFFSAGTLPPNDQYLLPVTPIDATHGYTIVEIPCTELPTVFSGQGAFCTEALNTVSDSLNPSGYSDPIPTEYASFGHQIPLATQSQWEEVISDVQSIHTSVSVMRLKNFQVQSDFLLPRAVAYGAGMIDYFFRGQIEVTAPTEAVVAVLNQGATHSMSADGYPCVGSMASDGCAIFGFQKVRVNVRNVTPAISEAGVSGSPVAQTIGTSDGSGTQLVAVARYHRNTCYKPDLSGERTQVLAGSITEPTCTGSQVTRSAYQEISVSAPLTVVSGSLDGLSSGVEKTFDFTADPIPVNATDLFIQVVYKGPMADEPDGMAVGTLDVREPTFAAFWNNTDYWWDGSSGVWRARNGTDHDEGVMSFWACSGFPLKMMFEYDGGTATQAMIDPVTNSNVTGMVRLAFIYPPPTFSGQQKTVQGTPVRNAGDVQMFVNSAGTPGQFRQGNLENLLTATIAAPVATCNSSLPASAQYWCSDPIKQRRGQRFGAVALPMYEAPNGSGGSATDVDSVPMTAFAGVSVLSSGTVRFNTDTTLASCSAQPTSVPVTTEEQADEVYRKAAAEARELGVPVDGDQQ